LNRNKLGFSGAIERIAEGKERVKNSRFNEEQIIAILKQS
jgi:putative transposase